MRYLMCSVLVLVLAGCALPFSSGKLDGPEAPAPDDWSEIAAVEVVQLETRSADPYSVNIWVAGFPDALYVFAGDNHATWVQHMEADPNVRMRIGESIYRLHAERVTDATEFRRFADAWETKYGNRPRNESVAETWLFRLRAPGAQAVSPDHSAPAVVALALFSPRVRFFAD